MSPTKIIIPFPTVKAEKPWVKMSCSPVGKYSDLTRYSSRNWNARDKVCQEAQLWLRRGLMDQLYPMQYFRGDNFFPFMYDWVEHQYGHPVAPGLGIYFLDPNEGNWELNDVRQQIHASRSSGIGGVVFYRSDFFTRNCQGLYDTVKREFFPTPSLPSRMTWSIDTVSPSRPGDLFHDVEGNCLYWIGSDDHGERDLKLNDHDYVYYNIYGSDIYPVDVSSGKHLLKTRVTGSFFRLPASLSHYKYYAMTACDRFGNESGAAQEYQMEILRDLRPIWNPRSRLSSDGSKIDDLRTAPSSEPTSTKSKKKNRR